MKEKMKKIVKGMAVAAIAVSVVLGGISSPTIIEAKGTAFINKKVKIVTPAIKSAKRVNGRTTVTVSVPANKVKKLGKVKKVTVAYGSTKNSKKFEAVKATAKVTKKGKNQYTFTLNNKKLASYKNAYMTVRFDGKSNWSKLVKVSGKAMAHKVTEYHLQCECGKEWSNTTGFEELTNLWDKHSEDMRMKDYEDAGFSSSDSGEAGDIVSIEDILNLGAGNGKHAGYKTWSTSSYSN